MSKNVSVCVRACVCVCGFLKIVFVQGYGEECVGEIVSLVMDDGCG